MCVGEMIWCLIFMLFLFWGLIIGIVGELGSLIVVLSVLFGLLLSMLIWCVVMLCVLILSCCCLCFVGLFWFLMGRLRLFGLFLLSLSVGLWVIFIVWFCGCSLF